MGGSRRKEKGKRNFKKNKGNFENTLRRKMKFFEQFTTIFINPSTNEYKYILHRLQRSAKLLFIDSHMKFSRKTPSLVREINGLKERSPKAAHFAESPNKIFFT